MDKLRVAIMGASGLVGREIIRLLEDHPFFRLDALYGSQASAGSRLLIDRKGGVMEIQKADAEEITKRKFDFIFSAVSEQSATSLELELRSMNNRIVTNASGNRMLPDVPIVVPEVNYEEISALGGSGYILANGNCSTIGLVLGLAPLRNFGPRNVDVTTMQAVSGAGYPGTPSLDIMSNVIPYISGEEEKMIRETRKIFSLGEKLDFSIAATCTRVPVVNGHMESVTVTFGSRLQESEVVDAFRSFRNHELPGRLPSLPEHPLILRGEVDRPQPRIDAGESQDMKSGMQVSIGRIRISENRLQFILVVNNLIRGAAGSTLLNAEVAAVTGGYI